MNPLKKLASETAIYGVSSILGRLLSYLLIILHTAVFVDSEYGAITNLYAYTAFFNVLCTFGMETAFFRYASKHQDRKDQIFSQANIFVLSLSILITALIFFNSHDIALWLEYQGNEEYIQWLAMIILIDAVVAIPFARVRLENRPKFFAIVRVSSIVLTIVLNIVFLYVFPGVSQQKFLGFLKPIIDGIYDPDLGVGYVFLANLFGNAIMIIFLWKYLFSLRINFEWSEIKLMLIYATPILITGLAGMTNEQLDKILLRELWPDGFLDKNAEEALGIYGACFKLSVFMLLAIQAFRYAGEPFFFSNARDKQAPELFAKVMYYFVLLSLVIFVGVSLNVGLIGSIFLRNPEYRIGLYVVPYLLLGKLFFGIYVNLSIWYKLTGQTMFGTYFSLVGAALTILGNFLLIPVIGFLGSAIASIMAYVGMSVVCFWFGKKYFPIPYPVKSILIHIAAATGLIILFFQIPFINADMEYVIGILITIIYVMVLFFMEKDRIRKRT